MGAFDPVVTYEKGTYIGEKTAGWVARLTCLLTARNRYRQYVSWLFSRLRSH